MAIAATINQSRQQTLYNEISYAIRLLPRDQLIDWAKASVVLFGSVTLRRTRNLGNALGTLGRGILSEATDAASAAKQGSFLDHMKRRAQDTASAASNVASGGAAALGKLATALTANPADVAPKLVVGSLAFLAASGGVDGDGGVPDLDLMAGIGAHRSIFTHSIISGAVIEATLASVARLIGMVHQYLPATHDPIWDAIATNKDKYLTATAQGASLGIAYHLFVDTAIEPAAYKDLPGSLPMAAHQTIMGANAVAEGLDASKKHKTFRHP